MGEESTQKPEVPVSQMVKKKEEKKKGGGPLLQRFFFFLKSSICSQEQALRGKRKTQRSSESSWAAAHPRFSALPQAYSSVLEQISWKEDVTSQLYHS